MTPFPPPTPGYSTSLLLWWLTDGSSRFMPSYPSHRSVNIHDLLHCIVRCRERREAEVERLEANEIRCLSRELSPFQDDKGPLGYISRWYIFFLWFFQVWCLVKRDTWQQTSSGVSRRGGIGASIKRILVLLDMSRRSFVTHAIDEKNARWCKIKYCSYSSHRRLLQFIT